nr:MAG TPA: hypothetical protein [Caudoviricetes sp.]
MDNILLLQQFHMVFLHHLTLKSFYQTLSFNLFLINLYLQ